MDIKPTILFVNAHVWFESLESLLPESMPNFSFVSAHSIEEAIEKITSHRVDGMIIHMQLPELHEDLVRLGIIDRDESAGHQTYLIEDFMSFCGGIELTKRIIDEFSRNEQLVINGLLKIPTIYFTGNHEEEIETRLLHLHAMLTFRIIWMPVTSDEFFSSVKQFFNIWFP